MNTAIKKGEQYNEKIKEDGSKVQDEEAWHDELLRQERRRFFLLQALEELYLSHEKT